MADEIVEIELSQPPLPSPAPLAPAHGLLAALMGSNVVALIVGGLYEYLSLRGVVSMGLAWVVLIFVWLLGVFGIVLSEYVWGKGQPHRIRYGFIAAIASAILLFGFHKGVSAVIRSHGSYTQTQPKPNVDCHSGSTGAPVAQGDGNIVISGNCNNVDPSGDMKGKRGSKK
jgi:hypothetical protein